MSKAKRTPKKERYSHKRAAEKLAGCVIFALSHRKHLSHGSGLMMKRDPKTGKLGIGRRWEEDFFDALEYCGIVYDRDKYYAGTGKRRSS